MQVRIFSSDDADHLQDLINAWLDDNGWKIKNVDMKLSSTVTLDQIRHTVLIQYDYDYT